MPVRNFKKWVDDRMYSFLKKKKCPCQSQLKEPPWVPQWTKLAKFNDNARPVELSNNDWVYDPAYSRLNGNIFHINDVD